MAGKKLNEAFISVNQLQKELELKAIEEMENLYHHLSLRNKSYLDYQENIDHIMIVAPSQESGVFKKEKGL